MVSEQFSSDRLYPFRVFLSYSRKDRKLVEKIVSIMDDVGLEPLWDTQINPGLPFPDEIRQLISRSHLFMPVITRTSRKSAWVLQEIGFALALNIPVLPLSINGQIAEVMLSTTQALIIKSNLSNLAEQLRNAKLPQLVVPQPAKPYDPTFVAITPEERAEHIVKYSEWVIGLKKHGMVRAQAKLTSFSIPDQDINNPVWDIFDAGNTLRNHQRQERIILERHALMEGCKLIIEPHTHPHRSVSQAEIDNFIGFYEKNSPG